MAMRRPNVFSDNLIRRAVGTMEVAIIVEFEAMEGRGDQFAALLRDHARRTLEEEPGCLRFDVLQQVDAAGAPIEGRFIANELYASDLAVKAHEENPRLARVRAAAEPLVKSRRLVMARLVQTRPPEEGIRPEDLSAANDD